MLFTALAMYLIYRIPGVVGEFAGMTATLALYAMPLAGTWAYGQTQSILINGLIPLSDAANYYSDALRIMHGWDISTFSAMRPISPGFLAFLLSITGHNLMSALGILTALAAVAAYLSARQIQKTHGAEPAVLFLMCMFLYFRHHSGTTLSEPLGIIISLLAITLIWRGIDMKNEWISLFGVTMSALALNIRPGAMFVLPALLVWGCLFFRGSRNFSFKFLALGSAFIGIVFILNSVLVKALAGPDGIAFANFSWAVYGLASGGNSWTYIFQAHPEIYSMTPGDQNRAIYQFAFDLIRQNPSLLAAGALKYWGFFFSNTWYNAFAFLEGNNYYVNEAARWSAYILCGFAAFKWFIDRQDGYTSLIILGALGVLASVPFVPPTDGYRVRLYAATIPYFGLLPAMGLAFLRDKINSRFTPKTAPEAPVPIWTLHFSALLTVILIVSPLPIKVYGASPAFQLANCPSPMSKIAVEFDPGAYINITRENLSYIDWMPDFHTSAFRRNIHNLADSHLIEFLGSVDPPSTLFQTLDFQNNSEVLVIIKTDELPKPGRTFSLCGYWNDDPNLGAYRIFQAEYTLGN